ncbi:MAG: heme lyase CcmF/NrfE family subunit [Proteobacteria bacterium]|nr:heme lyase CcmF/NrfE family subunit [Pseudomonadota bacterium]
MLALLGDDLLCVAGLLALLAGLGGWAAPSFKKPLPFRLLRAALLGVFLLMLSAFAVLILAYMRSDFSVMSVYQNSHTAKPLFYKIAAAWGGHEGSMILWTLIASLFGAVLALRPALSAGFTARALSVQALMIAAFIAFIFFTSDPFTLLVPTPTEGLGLNPILQDPALAMHPPILYLGYVGFSLAFSFAVAGLLEAKIDPAWATALRGYALFAWAALTIGIALGSWWAYYELGWGGWWFWDPVENASFIPWLSATALVHALVVLEKRGSLKAWAALLALLTFTLSLCGTFLVRSGAITSVHAFALDPARGIFILLLIGLAAGGGLLIFGLRAPKLFAEGVFAPVSRESLLTLNSLFFFTGCMTVLIGTVYPLALELLAGISISVGAPYFRQSFVPLMVPAVVLMGLGPYALWKKDSLRALFPRLQTAFLLTLALLLGTFLFFHTREMRFYLGITLAGWVFFATLHEAWLRRQQTGKIPRRGWGMMLAHLGFAVTLSGMVVSSHFSQESLALLKPGGALKLDGLTVRFEELERLPGPNYLSDRAEMRVSDGQSTVALMHPERRYYPVAQRVISQVAIHTNGFSNIYVVLGEPQNDQGRVKGWTVRASIHPLAPWIWFGCVMMAAGGLLAAPGRLTKPQSR